MTTLHIEHAITDFATWRAAFARFEESRLEAGATAHRIFRPADDDHYVVVHVDFGDATQAAAFLEMLRTKVWADPAASPALQGQPRARLLEPAG